MYIVYVSAYATGGSIRAGVGTTSGQWSTSNMAYAAAQFVYIREFEKEVSLETVVYPEYVADDIIYTNILAIRIK